MATTGYLDRPPKLADYYFNHFNAGFLSRSIYTDRFLAKIVRLQYLARTDHLQINKLETFETEVKLSPKEKFTRNSPRKPLFYFSL